MHLRPHTAPNHGADPKPNPNQVAFADRILLNKTDLVEESELAPIEERLKKINPTAAVFRTEQSKADPSKLIGISAFKLEKVLDTAPRSHANPNLTLTLTLILTLTLTLTLTPGARDGPGVPEHGGRARARPQRVLDEHQVPCSLQPAACSLLADPNPNSDP